MVEFGAVGASLPRLIFYVWRNHITVRSTGKHNYAVNKPWKNLDMRILAIIPARGGSKGIPRKNIADVNGKPLIAYSIEIGQQLIRDNVISRCIVSTDDEEIASVARLLGADVPFLRPAYAATDNAKSIELVKHALSELEKVEEKYDAIMILQPTSPIRNAEAIDNAVARFAFGESDSLISCYREEYINNLVMYDSDGLNYLRPRNADHNKGIRRQEQSFPYIRNGALYLTRVDYLLATSRLLCDRPMLLEMRKIDSLDVDTPDDLELLRAVLACK